MQTLEKKGKGVSRANTTNTSDARENTHEIARRSEQFQQKKLPSLPNVETRIRIPSAGNTKESRG
jgi:hypothetical protein